LSAGKCIHFDAIPKHALDLVKTINIKNSFSVGQGLSRTDCKLHKESILDWDKGLLTEGFRIRTIRSLNKQNLR
jgi:hypothetical protein